MRSSPLPRTWRSTPTPSRRPATRSLSRSRESCGPPRLPGFDRFHLVGYSAGGASSLAFAARPSGAAAKPRPARARVGGERRARSGRGGRAARARPDHDPPAGQQLMPAFVRAQLRPGVEPPPPPPGPMPPWMAKRPAGLKAIIAAFSAGELDLEAFRRFRRPVYFALGGLSTRTTTGRWRCVWPVCFQTSRSRRSRTATISTRRTELSRSGSPARLRNLWARAERA